MTKPWTRSRRRAERLRLRQVVPSHATLRVLFGGSNAPKVSDAIAIAKEEGGYEPVGAGLHACTFRLATAESLMRFDRLADLAKRWCVQEATLGGYDVDFGRVRWMVYHALSRPHGSPLPAETADALAGLACLEAMLVRASELALPVPIIGELMKEAITALERRPRSDERRSRILDRIEETIEATHWLIGSGRLPPTNPPGRIEEATWSVIQCFARWTLSGQRPEHCRGRPKGLVVPFPCVQYSPAEGDSYKAAAPRIPALRRAAARFQGAWCPAFDVEPAIVRIKRSRDNARAEEKAARQEARARRRRPVPPVTVTSFSRTDGLGVLRAGRTMLGILDENKRLDASIRRFQAIADGKSVACACCARPIAASHVAEWFRERHGDAPDGLEPRARAERVVVALQTTARFARGFEAGLCLDCNSDPMHETCTKCGVALALANTEAMIESILSVNPTGGKMSAPDLALFDPHSAEAASGLCGACISSRPA